MFEVFRCPFENQFNYSVLKCFAWGGVGWGSVKSSIWGGGRGGWTK